MTLTRKIGFLLLLPVLGALASLGVFYALHTQIAEDAPVINLAGRQRLYAQQLLTYANMVRAGQEKDRAALLDLTDLYERALTVLEHGGELMGQVFPPAPAEVLDEIAEIKQLWAGQGAALRLIAKRPAHAPDMEDVYRAAHLNTPPLVAAADKVVTALTLRNRTLQRRTLNVLLGSAAFNFLLLLSGIFITRQYIIAQKHSEQTLRETAERRRLLMESANDAIFVADVETGEIVECNKKASELIGLPPERIVGLHQSKLHPPELAEYYRQKFRENSRPEGALIKDMLVQHRDGHRIPVEISASTLELGGKTYVQGIFRDVSERQRRTRPCTRSRPGSPLPPAMTFSIPSSANWAGPWARTTPWWRRARMAKPPAPWRSAPTDRSPTTSSIRCKARPATTCSTASSAITRTTWRRNSPTTSCSPRCRSRATWACR
ncbi:MAG: hypothetical protein A2140_09475 [Candidatus Muproteobacteria bacterium RBG_16_62_13]|uniref:PAS domain-containing protein n=1 Tax=Candidatus Muproteobacteria bacterium RBG_16_62_13 TaxID=1817756 RepID=A0A1F6SYW8_9PROT|nr:MAG: hypothetical protein A2140_09475 [Candidatus Muproteobacteria bacterium RBG_16_62_13]